MMLILPDFKHLWGLGMEGLARASVSWSHTRVVEWAAEVLDMSSGEQEGAGGVVWPRPQEPLSQYVSGSCG